MESGASSERAVRLTKLYEKLMTVTFARHVTQERLDDLQYSCISFQPLDNATLYLMIKKWTIVHPHREDNPRWSNFGKSGPTADAMSPLGTPPVVITWKARPDGSYELGKKAWYLVYRRWLVLTGDEGEVRVDRDEAEKIYEARDKPQKVNWTWGIFEAKRTPIEYLNGLGLVIGYRRAVGRTEIEQGIAAETWGGHRGAFTYFLEAKTYSEHGDVDKCENSELIQELDDAWKVAKQAKSLLYHKKGPLDTRYPCKVTNVLVFSEGSEVFTDPLPIKRTNVYSTVSGTIDISPPVDPPRETLALETGDPRTSHCKIIDVVRNLVDISSAAKNQCDAAETEATMVKAEVAAAEKDFSEPEHDLKMLHLKAAKIYQDLETIRTRRQEQTYEAAGLRLEADKNNAMLRAAEMSRQKQIELNALQLKSEKAEEKANAARKHHADLETVLATTREIAEELNGNI